jgi:hypothetical protein
VSLSWWGISRDGDQIIGSRHDGEQIGFVWSSATHPPASLYFFLASLESSGRQEERANNKSPGLLRPSQVLHFSLVASACILGLFDSWTKPRSAKLEWRETRIADFGVLIQRLIRPI